MKEERMIPSLAQIEGLEYLRIKCGDRNMAVSQVQEELFRATISHKINLRVLDLEGRLAFENLVG